VRTMVHDLKLRLHSMKGVRLRHLPFESILLTLAFLWRLELGRQR